MAQYNFTKNTVLMRQLHDEIVSSSIAEVLVGIVNSGEATSNLDIDMTGVLTTGDETTLTNLVNDHVPIVENPIVDVPGAAVMKETTVALNGAGPDIPTEDGAICLMRGNSPNANLLWKESKGKWQAGTEGAEIDIALDGHIHDTADITTGSFVDARIAASNVTQHQASLVLTESQISDFGTYLTSYTEANDLTLAVTWVNVPNANITQSAVTQHQAALSILESQIIDLNTYALDSTVVHNTGVESIGGNKTFSNNVTISGDFIVNGTTTTVNTAELAVSDNIITLNSDEVGAPSQNSGIEVERGTSTNAVLQWNEGSDIWEAGIAGAEVGLSLVGHEHAAADVTSGAFVDARISQTSVTQHQAALTLTESQISDFGTYLTSYTEVNDLSTTVTWVNVPSANITQAAVTQHQAALSVTESQISDLGSYETAFAKNTAFNKDFGTFTGTVTQGNDPRLFDARTPTAHTHYKADITDFSDGDYATSAQGTLAASALQNITNESINDLSNVYSAMTPADGQVLTFDTTNGWQSETPASGVTDHTLLSNIGTNTHTAIDTHIADGTTHYTQASISITESQISDLGSYETAFVKNPAFNKDFGTSAGSVTEGNDARLSDARTPTAHTHVKANITDFAEGDYATAAQGMQAASALQNITNESINDLSNVYSAMAPADGQVLTFDTTNGWQSETPASGVTDHTLLSNIGTNTHTAIDTHIADATKHYTQASISITESQISDLGTYSPTSHNHTLDGLSNTTITSNTTGEILSWNGTAWINSTLAEAGISSDEHSHPVATIPENTIMGRIAGTGTGVPLSLSPTVATDFLNVFTSTTKGLVPYSINNETKFLRGDGTWVMPTDTVTNSFSNIAVATQSTLVADALTDTLTVVGGTGITITTDAGTDTLTIAASGSGMLDDLTDVIITNPVLDQMLTYSGSGWVNVTMQTAASNKLMNTWTLLSGNLYYNDFSHNLDTTEIAVYIYNTTTKQEVRTEYTEIIDANTLRVVVNGNSANLTCNVTTGAMGAPGPTGPAGGGMANILEDTTPQLGGNLDMNGNSIIAAGPVTISPTEMSYIDGVTSNIQTQLSSKTTATGHTHVYRLPHTWGISGEIAVASGDTKYLLPMFISLAVGQTANIVGAYSRINSGTSVTIAVKKNGSSIGTGLPVSTTTNFHTFSQSVTSADMIQIEVTAVSGTPKNMTFTLFVEYTQ